MKLMYIITLTIVLSLHVPENEGGDDWIETYQDGMSQSEFVIKDSKSNVILTNTEKTIVLYPHFESKFTMGRLMNYSYALYSDWGYLTIANPSQEPANVYSSEFHFHSPSEYTVNDKKYDLEMHIVMKNPNAPGSICVLVIFFDVDGKTNKFISQVIDSEKNSTDVNLNDVFNGVDKIEKIYEFEGPLTTPPYLEGAKWYLWSEIQDLDENQRLFFHKFTDKNENERNAQEWIDKMAIRFGERDDLSIKLEFSIFLLIVSMSLCLS